MSFGFEPSPNPKNRFQIFVKDLQGRSLTFEVYPDTTVIELKHMIFTRCQIAVASQRLLFQGKQLVDEHTMEFSGIRKGMNATIHLALRCRGG
ncbi:ubiquitin-like protein 4A [Anneissia japonica]|uniref:ubiquitin-like protein 4A n=1 Tax=Anneissia japonica TaxID=1529436 RepID=UPI0014256B2E|nr:ubiquitin-like protein 4A [Anneissia japonica]